MNDGHELTAVQNTNVSVGKIITNEHGDPEVGDSDSRTYTNQDSDGCIDSHTF